MSRSQVKGEAEASEGVVWAGGRGHHVRRVGCMQGQDQYNALKKTTYVSRTLAVVK